VIWTQTRLCVRRRPADRPRAVRATGRVLDVHARYLLEILAHQKAETAVPADRPERCQTGRRLSAGLR